MKYLVLLLCVYGSSSILPEHKSKSNTSNSTKIDMRDLDIASIASSTILFVLYKHPCPECKNRGDRKEANLDESEWFISRHYGKLDRELNKIFKSYAGKHLIVREEDFEIETFDAEEYRYVVKRGGAYLDYAPYDNSSKWVMDWYMLDRKTGRNIYLDPRRFGKEMHGKIKSSVRYLNRELRALASKKAKN